MKSGYKTSEFAAALTVIIGSFASIGLISQQDVEGLVKLAEAAMGFLTTAFIAYQYIKGRTEVKKTMIEVQGPTETMAVETAAPVEEEIPTEGPFEVEPDADNPILPEPEE